MRVLVTGCAGFIGSHLCEKLLQLGCTVVGVDSFTDYYPRTLKQQNIASFLHHPRFHFVEADLLLLDLAEVLKGVEAVFHEAAQPGVRGSWGSTFEIYTQNNVLATQKLLESAKGFPLKKFVYASSSSIYGDAESYPTPETTTPRPISPYGVSKLAAEHLCYLYWREYGVPTVSLRYFSVYGPRQRPDMAFNKFVLALLGGSRISVYGDGEQTRDFTFIGDVVAANVQAMESSVQGEAMNIGGGARTTVNRVLEILAKLTGRIPQLDYQPVQKGDARDTMADTGKAARLIGYSPTISLEEGLAREVDWLRNAPR